MNVQWGIKTFETLNKILRDFKRCDVLMGGITFSLPGDFQQTLPVVPRGTPADYLNGCLRLLYLRTFDDNCTRML